MHKAALIFWVLMVPAFVWLFVFYIIRDFVRLHRRHKRRMAEFDRIDNLMRKAYWELKFGDLSEATRLNNEYTEARDRLFKDMAEGK